MADLPSMPSTIWLSREERRALARERRQPTATTTPTAGRCLYCFDQLTNGSPVCSQDCDEGWWRVVPTTDGELWLPAERAALVDGLEALARV
jgi:hypothetical protein